MRSKNQRLKGEDQKHRGGLQLEGATALRGPGREVVSGACHLAQTGRHHGSTQRQTHRVV